ncbi:MAG: bifunctional folylpolyglutamate synthase/dihydrofolate synthase [Desulfobacterales bacterium]|nr:MAG: bifunctional folylpolyglutamate synthase/dihydrofolate synthase [Desulfobacterales bacterium]
MYGLRRFGIKLGLATIKRILAGLGNPQADYACIHVAGTNGKGSVASSLATILHHAGYKVGLYTSPHLVRFNERICINNRPISDEAVVASYRAVKEVHSGGREPTFFEFSTAMALFEFGRQRVDWAVIETGMGGRLDATNAVCPAVAIITNVSLEHREYLGNTLIQIAHEKAGIIKRRTPVVTGIRQSGPLAIVDTIAAARSAPLYRLGRDFRVRRHPSGGFSYFGIENVWRRLTTALSGDHQIENAALVLATCELLNRNAVGLAFDNIKAGLATNQWPGRLEIVATEPHIILDGAHNLMAARKLARFLSKNLADRPITLVVGILADKPYAAMLHSLLPPCRRVILTCPQIDRGLPPEKLYAVAQDLKADSRIIPVVAEAVRYAVQTAKPQDVICIAGSLYVVGEAKTALVNMGY